MANRFWMPKVNVKIDNVGPAVGFCTSSEMRIFDTVQKGHASLAKKAFPCT